VLWLRPANRQIKDNMSAPIHKSAGNRANQRMPGQGFELCVLGRLFDVVLVLLQMMVKMNARSTTLNEENRLSVCA
jgi:hypothetical protein